MPADSVTEFQAHLARAHKYRESAQWEFTVRELQEAKSLCERRGFPDAAWRRREILGQLGGVERRVGQYDAAKKHLEEVVEDDQTDDAQRLEVSGELSVVYRHLNDFVRARDICSNQYLVAKRLALKAEEEMCRAIGNLGMANYQLSQEHQDKDLLHLAITQVLERVERARSLQTKLQTEDPSSKTIRKARTWESIGYNRLTLCYAAHGQTAEAVKYGKMSQEMTRDSPDPTVRAFSRFFCGYAYLRHGDHEKALELFSFTSPQDQCTSAIALCKEPTDEYCEYIKILVSLGINLEHYDEQGYSALDYAVFSGHQGVQDVVLDGLTTSPSLSADDVRQLFQGAILKKHYKEIFQECLRPELNRGESIQSMRVSYAQLLSRDPGKKRLFDDFRFVRYYDFVRHGRMPAWTDGLLQNFNDAPKAHVGSGFDPYVVFFSYRWIGGLVPDDAENTQYRRMLNAVEDLLKDSDIDLGSIYIWVACIDQDHKEPGINALPAIIALCNVVVSLTDDTYFHRAWCAVEASMIQTLVNSHGQHSWYEHKLSAPAADRITGSIASCAAQVDVNPSSLPVTIESDRLKISFLYKQSILLGKATG